MKLSFQSVADFGLDTSAKILNAGFSDYLIPVQISTTGLLSMVRQDSVDLQQCVKQYEFSYLALSNPDAPTIVVRAIVTRPDARRRGHATQLLRAVIARHSEKTWRVPATFPEEWGGLFEKSGFTRENLSQGQMQREVNDAN